MSLAHERTTQFLEGARREHRQIMTPEGVAVTVELADHGERLVALVLDLLIWLLLTLAIYVPVILTLGVGNASLIAISIVLFIGFLVRNLYFLYFELAWRGATPGKRLVGLRVIDRAGGPLLPSAIVARNLTREIETFLPLSVLVTWGRGADGTLAWENFAIAVWMLLFAALPFFNRDRLRGGDLIAGTMVIALPRRVLSSDLVEQTVQFSFNEQQLRAYGAFELQVLEELLRHPDTPESELVLAEVCEKIRHKIGWSQAVPKADVLPFLRQFYTAERAFLEREQLYGKLRPDKHAQAAKKP
ncbi:MAG: RDD family protein [Xanthobacteraceae bacterium]